MNASEWRYGLLLPHFGAHAAPERVVEGARLAERLGFDSVWVRDHLVFRPHHMEDQDKTHLEPLTVLAAIGARTSRVVLGTGSLIPYRHPIHLAAELATLSRFVGDRLIAGVGLGSFDHEFVAAGMAGIDRAELLAEQVAVLRKLWTGTPITHDGKHYRFVDVTIRPTPAAPIPIWYCGQSLAAVRRAVEYCEGFMPGRITVRTFALRVERLRRLAAEVGRPAPVAAAIPIVSPGRTREEALAKVNVAGLVAEANRHKRWVPPPSGRFATAEDIEGALIAGPPPDIAAVVERFHAAGASQLVFDLRYRFAEFEDCLRLLGEEVLPLLRPARDLRPLAATRTGPAGQSPSAGPRSFR